MGTSGWLRSEEGCASVTSRGGFMSNLDWNIRCYCTTISSRKNRFGLLVRSGRRYRLIIERWYLLSRRQETATPEGSAFKRLQRRNLRSPRQAPSSCDSDTRLSNSCDGLGFATDLNSGLNKPSAPRLALYHLHAEYYEPSQVWPLKRQCFNARNHTESNVSHPL
jgi:hypothetical protein